MENDQNNNGNKWRTYILIGILILILGACVNAYGSDDNECPLCNGRGYINYKACPNCHGSGTDW